jgi:hypothetical protein
VQEEVLRRGKYRCELGGNRIGKNSAKRPIDFVILRLKHTFILIIDSVICVLLNAAKCMYLQHCNF